MQHNTEKLAKVIRHFILTSSTEAGSGHPSSSLSATDLMAVLFFGTPAGALAKEGGGFFKFDVSNPGYVNNDRLIFSKGHASPLFYSLWAAAGGIDAEELHTLRKFGSRLEGHPTMEFPFTECATGSLGQGLSVGVGMALNAKQDKLPYKTYVLLGDSEMAEGSVWEAMEIAQHYNLDNLVGIIDVNRLGQRGETLYGHHTEIYKKKAESFGWHAIAIDGHNLEEINSAFKEAQSVTGRPVMIVAKTLKGKGVSFIEDKDAWHGKPLSKEEMEKALPELGEVDLSIRGELPQPEKIEIKKTENLQLTTDNFTQYDKPVATRRAYGNALVNIFAAHPNMVVLDAETSNSTYAEIFKKEHPGNFYEMFIAEQNMVGAALGFSRRGKIPFASTFAAFYSRAFDQIRMSQYSDSNIKYVGSHAGVSIGEDGASQMALEDIAMFRTLHEGVVLYPSDGVSTEKLVALAAEHQGNVYIRTTRKDTAILYQHSESFEIGGSKVLRSSTNDQITVIGAGVTLHEALAAYDDLQKEGINIRVIDLYSIKPIDAGTLLRAAKETKALITVEDHYQEGGIGEAVRAALSNNPVPVHMLAVRKLAKSGKPDELLAYEEIDKSAIIKKVRQVVSSK